MEESLGSGFDSIRATIMPSTSFSTQVTVSSVFTQTESDLERPSYTHLEGAEPSDSSGRTTNLLSDPFLLRSNIRDTASVARSGGVGLLDHNMGPTHLNDARSSEALPSLDPSHRHSTCTSSYLAGGVEVEENFNLLGQEYSPSHSASEEYESDPDDTRKFYTELESNIRLENGDEDDDDDIEFEDSDDYETDSDSDYESSHLGQVIPSINYFDRRYYRYWDAEQTGITTNHLDTPLQATQEQNLTVDQFIKRWLHASLTNSAHMPSQFPSPSLEAAQVSKWPRPEKIVRPADLDFDQFYDIQQIPWKEKLGVHREDARILRDSWYYPYYNLNFLENKNPRTLPRGEHYFCEKALFTGFRATIEHFQLRNLMAVTSFNTVQFSHESQLLSWTPDYNDVRCIMNLSRPTPETGFQSPVKISTMQANDSISVAGGFSGEYCMHVSGSQGENTYGFVTKDINGITNHIDIIKNRTDLAPLVVFASNDQHIRTLHCASNQFIADHELSIPINCSETSADSRMRIVVGDSPDALVLEAESGRTLHHLRGHNDYGFACAWSPDMLHIATSNQDRTVNIWDVRMWRLLQTIHSDRTCYRSLRFSPVGGGPRTLLMCEPADRIAIVNATTYESRQVHDFFGEIGGANYTPDGESIWVANTDEVFGGFMRFDRMQYGQRYASSGSSSRSYQKTPSEDDDGVEARKFYSPEWYSNLPHEWINEAGLEEDSGCVVSQRERDFRVLNGLSDDARDNLLV